MYLPTFTDPVKVIRSQSGSVIMASPMVDGLPVTTDSISGGRPASYSTSASASAVSGVSSVGLSTTRVIERRDRRDHAVERKARGEDLALLALRRDVARIGLAVVLDRQLARERI